MIIHKGWASRLALLHLIGVYIDESMAGMLWLEKHCMDLENG
jgi:hypothetical protein